MKLYLDGDTSSPSFSVYRAGNFVENGGGFYLKSDDGSLSMLQTWVDSDRRDVLRKLRRIVALFNKESK